MKIKSLHSWDISVKEAIMVQVKLRSLLDLKAGPAGPPEKIAGVDVTSDNGRMIGGVIILRYPGLETIEKKYSVMPVNFPYIPGLLSFREGPVLLESFKNIENIPDVIIFDGHGIAHTRRMGLASHLGIILNRPSIGCAKSVLTGKYQMPGKRKGDYSLLEDDGEILGAALRTKQGVKPVFVSPGHRIDLNTSIRVVLKSLSGYKLPEPTRLAHIFVNKIRKELS